MSHTRSLNAPSIDPREIAYFEKLAHRWWDAARPFWPLHRFAEDLEQTGEQFDAVLNMEVVEHVENLSEFLPACGNLVRPGGLMVVATINRTLAALLFAPARRSPSGTIDRRVWYRGTRPRTAPVLTCQSGRRA